MNESNLPIFDSNRNATSQAPPSPTRRVPAFASSPSLATQNASTTTTDSDVPPWGGGESDRPETLALEPARFDESRHSLMICSIAFLIGSIVCATLSRAQPPSDGVRPDAIVRPADEASRPFSLDGEDPIG